MVKTVRAPLKSPKCLPLFWDGSTLIWTPHQTHSFFTVLAIGTITTSVTYSQNYPSYFQPAWHQELLALLITETQPCILNTNGFIHKCPGLGIPGIVGTSTKSSRRVASIVKVPVWLKVDVATLAVASSFQATGRRRKEKVIGYAPADYTSTEELSGSPTHQLPHDHTWLCGILELPSFLKLVATLNRISFYY